MLHELVQINFATLMVIIFLILFLCTNHFLERRVVFLFTFAALSVLVLITVDSIEYWTASLDHPTALRVWMSAVGYSIRPAIIYMVILMVKRNRKMNRMLMAVPLFINAVVSFMALFTGIVFSYTEANKFARGPLGYTPFLVSAFYIILLMIDTIGEHWNQNNLEPVIAIAVAVASVVSTAMESLAGYEGIINATGAVSVAFYCMYLNAQQFKRDPLTNVFNRRCFFMDAERGKNTLTAVLSMDLNNLKQINDKNGHGEGDRAICEMVNCVQPVLDKRCFLYRVGGDEFMVLCFRRKKDAVRRLAERIRQEMEKTQYGCAIGVVFLEKGMELEDALKIADQEMYRDKQRQKQ